MIKTLDILSKCSETYYLMGEYYILNESECNTIEEELGENIFNKPSIKIEVTDGIYDLLYNKAFDKWPDDPFFKLIGSKEVTDGTKIKFERPMGSMDELKEGDWIKWAKKDYYVVSSKLDGLSVKLFYENGVLVQASSRGDGFEGSDITRHILQIDNIPHKIRIKDKVEIRGELICPKKDIQSMINDLKDETGKEYKNGRNTIAGFLNSKKTLLSVAKYAHFVAFDNDLDVKTELERFDKLKDLGFETPAYALRFYPNEEDLIRMVVNVKNNDPYECDGIILTLNIPDNEHKGFETGSINPKKSRKFKIGATNNSAETIVTNIIWNVSKAGKLIPTVEIEPINVVGVTIKYATGHNYKNIVENGIGIGSRIVVKRSGDVIPYIDKILEPRFNVYNLPDIEYFENGVDIELKDKKTINEYTKQMTVARLAFFAKSLGIDYLGEGVCELVNNTFLSKANKFADEYYILTMPKEVWVNIVGENGNKIYDSIQKVKETSTEVDYMAAFNAFGENIGKSILNSVFDKYHTLDVTYSQLKMIHGFADTRIFQYESYLDNYRIIKENLKSKGINFIINIVKNESDKFKDYIVCFTGVRDKELSDYIKKNGGVATDSWNKNVNLLVCANPNGVSGKITKAKEKGIKCVSLEEAKEIFK